MFQLSKKKIIIGISIWVVAIVLTVFFTLLTNKDTKTSVKEEPKVIEEKKEEVKENPYKTTVFDTYDNNDLEVYEYEVNKTFGYHQIKYLKNNDLQKKINEILHDKAINLYNKVKKYDDIYFYSYVGFNANGLLSVYMDASGNDKKEKYHSFSDSLNINLSTGEELTLQDLFYDEQKMYTAYASAAASEIAINQAEEDFYKDKFKPNNVANMEDRIFKYINEIQKGNYLFSFSDSDVDIEVDGFSVSIPIEDCVENTIYFKKYIPTTDLFTGEYKGLKHISIFSRTPSNDDYYNVKKINDNIFLDVHLFGPDQQKNNDMKKIIKISKIEEYINKLVSSANKNKYTLISAGGDIMYFPDYNFYSIESKFGVYYSDIKYKDFMLNKMIKSKRGDYASYGNLVYIENKNVKCKEYDYIVNVDVNKNKIITLDNLFKEGYDYKTVLKDEFIEYCIEIEDLTIEQAEKMWNSNKIKFVFKNGEISIEYDELPYTEVSLDKFDRSNLTI